MVNEMRDRLKENISIIKQHNERGLPVKYITKGQKYENEVIAEIVEDVSLIIEKMENETLIELPCKVGDTVYKLKKFCEENTGYKEFYRPSKEFENDCPYLDPQSWVYDCDRCKAVEDCDEGCYCTINVKIFCDTCKERLAIQKDKFTLSMVHSVFNTPMFNTNTSLEDTYFLTKAEAEQKLKEMRGD